METHRATALVIVPYFVLGKKLRQFEVLNLQFVHVFCDTFISLCTQECVLKTLNLRASNETSRSPIDLFVSEISTGIVAAVAAGKGYLGKD